jgi:hypothetical protein
VERFVALIVAGLIVRVAKDGLHLPLGVLEFYLFVFLFLRIHLLFALPLVGRHAFLAWLLLFFMELFHELLDHPALTCTMAHGVMHRASGATVVAARRMMGALVPSWDFAPTCRHSCSCGGTSQWLAIATDLLVVVVAALSSGPHVGLAILACLLGR